MLTAKSLQALKPREKPYKKADAKGLYVIVRPTGAKWWRFKYHYRGREKALSLGTYPDVPLSRAREKRDKFRSLLDRGIDPSAKRRADKHAQENTLKAIADEWFEHGCPPRSNKRPLAPQTVQTMRTRLKSFIYPHFGNWPITDITAQDLLRVLRKIESTGRHETARLVRSLVGRIFRYAIGTGRADRDISADLRDALRPAQVRHFAALTDPKAVAFLLRSIEHYSGQPSTVAALKTISLTFVRPGELRMSRWGEFDLTNAQWVIPADRTKMRREHIVPLSTQVVDILRELVGLTDKGPDSFVFPSLRPRRPLSENTLNIALRNMGFDGDTHVAHGFRSTASTLLHELGWSPEVIETQLAHARPGVGGIYNRSHLLPQRRKMMQAWADYLECLKSGGQVTAIGLGIQA